LNCVIYIFDNTRLLLYYVKIACKKRKIHNCPNFHLPGCSSCLMRFMQRYYYTQHNTALELHTSSKEEALSRERRILQQIIQQREVNYFQHESKPKENNNIKERHFLIPCASKAAVIFPPPSQKQKRKCFAPLLIVSDCALAQ